MAGDADPTRSDAALTQPVPALPGLLDPALIDQARQRLTGQTRRVSVTGDALTTPDGATVSFALEFMQHTGTFKARGALNFLGAHIDSGSLPDSGVTIASGGNAGVACAWAAQRVGARATVFLPETAPAPKVERLRAYGAEVRLQGTEYADAAQACAVFAEDSGALMSHAYDHPLIQAGAGTLVEEILEARPDTTVIAVSVGGGGLFAGVSAAARRRGLRVVAVEPENCRALNAALAAGAPVDVTVDSVAADSLGARRIAAAALAEAQQPHAVSVLVDDASIIAARRALWTEHRVVVEHAAATALAGIAAGGAGRAAGSAWLTAESTRRATEVTGTGIGPEDRVCAVLCGANTALDSLS
ncbi:pyridoxal-phosphate dependent enzyme [Brevibacterium album]|uniref:pyridoxal-phosphate dependent enzyme n=1 Tax=Brevibacterium album TaxID=417948 RepID=UPI000414D7AC|nr:pyridoxal-phosphate dependent enzyme [Brevibacterium album]